MKRSPTIGRGSSFSDTNIWFKVHMPIAEKLNTTDKVPDHLKQLIIPGAEICYTYWSSGYILTQKLHVLGYIVWSHHISVDRKTVLYPITNSHLATLNYTMEGTVDCLLKGFGMVQLQPRRYQLYFLPAAATNKAWLVPGQYEFFHIGFPISSVEVLTDKYPHFQQLLDLLQKDYKGTTFSELLPVNRIIEREINKIRHFEDVSSAGLFFILHAIVSLLNIYLEDMDRYLRRQELVQNLGNSLDGLEQYITDNLRYLDQRGDGNLLSLPRLLETFKMTKYQFSAAMQEKYHMTLEGLIHDIRMKKGHVLLQSRWDMDLEEIAFELGYSSLASFSRSFKDYYKVSPSDLRKTKI